MIRKHTCYSHNQLSFIGKRIHPAFSKIINNGMYAASQLEGLYIAHLEDDGTYFGIFPEDPSFGDDPEEHKRLFDLYVECYYYVINNHPICLL